MLAIPATSLAAVEDNGPKAVVQAAVSGIVNVLKQRTHQDTLTEKDRVAIRQQLENRFDYAEMARRSVGQDWRKQTETQRNDFTIVFRDLLEYTYGNRLATYKNQTIEYDKAEFRGDRARVKTRVIDGSRTTPVDYYLHQTDHGWMVYDIKIEGVSLVGTFREDFKSSLRQDGFDALLNALKKKVAKMKETAATTA